MTPVAMERGLHPTPTPSPTPEPVAAFAAIARALTGSLELPEVLRRIANEARALSDATGVSILLLRDGLAEFTAHASPPPGSLIPVGFRFEPGQELVAALRERAEPLIIRGLHASPLIPEVVKERIFVNDLVIVPLRASGELVGVLNLAFNRMPEPLPWDPVLFGALADQAAVAVRNAQLYEAARSSNEQLVHAEKLYALGRLVAQVTHELNNPLTTARLLAESLDQEPLPFGAMELVQSLSGELEHAANIVRDLLLFVHRGATTTSEIEPGDFIRRTITALDRRLAATGIAVALDIAEPLPPLHADPNALRQVLHNLVVNAIQALTGLDVERRIEVRARAEGTAAQRALVIEVEDNGAGIAPAVLDRLFEPFFTTKPIGEGTGLGLTIIKGIVEAHAGTIEALNTTTGGALFRLRLPAGTAAPAGTASPTTTRPAASARWMAGSRRATGTGAAATSPAKSRGDKETDLLSVLIIDDEPELQRALQRVLTNLGCEVTTALDGEIGIQHARARTFDLVLCDVRIPGLQGPDLLDRIRLQTPEIEDVLVFMTGDTITREIREFITASGRPSLTKPFGRAQLQQLLGNVRAARG
jgi:signal transduction histidine kinase